MTSMEDLAFPRSEHDIPSGLGGKIPANWKHIGGLTKREYYAGLTLHGIVANSEYMLNSAKAAKGDMDQLKQLIAVMSVAYADALIAELNKKPAAS